MLLQNMIIHEKLSEIRFSSLCHLMRPKCICISSKSYKDLLDELFPSVFPKSLFAMYCSTKMIEVRQLALPFGVAYMQICQLLVHQFGNIFEPVFHVC